MDNNTKCPKCEYTEFEVINGKPVNSNFDLIFVRCVQCKTLVGVLDFYNVGALIKKMAEKLNLDLNK